MGGKKSPPLVPSPSAEPGTNAPEAPDVERADQRNREGPLREIPLAQIRTNPYQPRREFRAEELADLEASLKVNGLLQPITVRPAATGTGFELIAGERRFRAATRLGWEKIPALIKEVSNRDALALALVENLQRADLDSVEEADGYQRLMQEFSATQQQVADAVGKDRSTVANALRLLQLPGSIRRLLQERKLTPGHARALLSLSSERDMTEMANQAISGAWSVREVERQVAAVRDARRAPATGTSSGPTAQKQTAAPAGSSSTQSAEVRRLEELLRRRLQTQVQISSTGKDRGDIRITFTSHEDLARVMELLGVPLE
jgi:ParB family chromosome partitioning protein